MRPTLAGMTLVLLDEQLSGGPCQVPIESTAG